MKKRIIFISSILLLLAVILYVFIFRLHTKASPALFAIPSSAVFVIDVPDVQVFDAMLHTETFTGLNSLQAIQEFEKGMSLMKSIAQTDEKLLQDISSGTVTAAAVMLAERKLDYVFVLQLEDAQKFDVRKAGIILKNEPPKTKTHEYEKEKVYEFSYKDTSVTFSAAKVFGLLIVSTSPVLTENAILQLKNANSKTQDAEFMKVYDAVHTKGNPSVFANLQELGGYLAAFSNDKYAGVANKLQHFAAWAGFHLDIHEDEILIQGFTSSSDMQLLSYAGGEPPGNAKKLLEKCNALIPSQAVCVSALLNENFSEYCSFRLKDVPDDLLFEKLQNYMQGVMVSGFSQTLSGNYNEKIFITIPVTDSAEVMQALSGITKPDTTQYKNYPVKKLLTAEVLNAITGFTEVKQYYYTCINNILLFCTSASELQNLIEAYCCSPGGVNPERYQDVTEQASVHNLTLYFDLERSEQIIYSMLNTEGKKNIEKMNKLCEIYSPVFFQFDKKADLFTFSGSVSISEKQEAAPGIAWKTLLDAPLAAEPVIIYNHIKREKNIVIQDTLHQLYLLSADGTISWKKQITSTIHGNIFPVDFYGNNKTQLLFATDDNIQMLDLNGNIAEGFQIDFTSLAVNDLSVFYNSAESSYIFFIACENGNVYGFDKEGKPLPGWNPLQGVGLVTTPLTYAAIGKEDFFVFMNAENEVMIKSGSGEMRRNTVQLETPILHLFQPYTKQQASSLLAIDAKGNVLQLRLADGKISVVSSGEQFSDGTISFIDNDTIADFVYVTTKSILAKTIKNKLIYSTTIPETADYKIQVCEMNNKNYTGIYSSLNKNIYLFDASGNIFNGFPLKGSGPFIIDDLTGTGKNILLTGENNYLTAYELK